MADQRWRLLSGCLYRIMINNGKDSLVMPLRPNAAQQRFLQLIRLGSHLNDPLTAPMLGTITVLPANPHMPFNLSVFLPLR